ncbi:MAG: GNAT family N-acetyltransferase [Anaerolineae bacterium]
MQIIEMTSAHLAAVLAIIERCDYDPRADLTWLQERTLDDPTCHPGLLLLAEQDDSIIGFVFACVREQHGLIKLFAIDEPYQRLGHATALLDEVERRLRERQVSEIAVQAMAPNYFAPGVDLRDTDAICFLEKRGYFTNRQAIVDMQVDLLRTSLDSSEDEERLHREGIVLRQAQADEVERVAAFARDVFSMGWYWEVLDATRYAPTPLFIALDGERIVGFSAYDVTGLARFGPTGTHPDYRCRGIGTALLKVSLRAIRDRGEALAEIGWVGPLGFYARAVGARISRAYWTFQKSVTTQG